MDAGHPRCPSAFLCPITHAIMTQPVIDPQGNSYEKEAINEWLARDGTSPVTRAPLSTHELAPNRALQDAIEQYMRAKIGAAHDNGAAAEGGLPAPKKIPAFRDEEADRSIQIVASSTDGPAVAGQATVMLTLQPPVGAGRTPTDVCCVVDVSGSMGAEATMKGDSGSTEAHGLSLLDVVKHAVTTVIGVLGPCDRLSLVAYSTEARVVFDLLVMDAAGKSQAQRELASLRCGGQTNLWDGLHNGLEVLRSGCSAEDNRLSAIMLLTDGQPNICPPRGHLEMLRKYKDQNLRLSTTISTFGFGYQLDSGLLRELAIEGDGMYAFIPDSGFVGTVFVNALSNLLVTMAKNTKLSLELVNGASIGPAGVPGGLPRQDTSWGTQLAVGSLQYGQPRHVILLVNLPEDFVSGAPLLQATLEFETRHDQGVPIRTSITANHQFGHEPLSPAGSSVAIAVQSIRLALIDKLQQAITVATAQRGVGPDVQAIIASLVGEIKASGLQDEHIQGMLIDVEGQATMALASREYYNKWGVHYLPSLVRAHQLEQCNNFKDPGVQNYGGELFCQLRDEADDLFCKLPPPKPSTPPRARDGYGAAATRRPVDMSMYNNRGNPCFAGECSVQMADGSSKSVDSLVKGDQVMVATTTTAMSDTQNETCTATVTCAVKTRCAGGKAELVELPGGLLVTPWHPVRTAGAVTGTKEPDLAWAFPATLAPMSTRACPAVYNFVLDSAHVLIINGVECVTLGHKIEGDLVVSHPFFGTGAIVEELQKMRGWSEGYVTLEPGCVLRDPTSGLACGLVEAQIDDRSRQYQA